MSGQKMKRRQKGFTLIELMAVVATIGTLAATSVGAYDAYRDRAYDAQAKKTLRDLKTALEAGRLDQTTTTDFLWAWSADAGSVTDWTGRAFLPGFKNTPKTQVWAWLDEACEQGLQGDACLMNGAGVSVCKAGISRSYMRWRDGVEISWSWNGVPWC